jgi:hypothetical protein
MHSLLHGRHRRRYVIPSHSGAQPLSRPNCWAQPDMMEVGNTLPPNHAAAKAPVLTHDESMVHFGLWAITSSPLVLGFDVTNDTMLSATWDIISNSEALGVNQAWFGHPGYLIRTATTTFNATVFHGASNDIKDPPSRLPSWQAWAKPQAHDNSTMAVFIGNYHPTDLQQDSLSLLELGLPQSHRVQTVRDVWKHSSCTVQSSVGGGAGSTCGLSGARGEQQLTFALGSRKSLFLVIESADVP